MTSLRRNVPGVLLPALLLAAGPVLSQAPDERVVLYPAYLARDEVSGAWQGHVHGNVHEVEDGPVTRLALVALREALGLSVDPTPAQESIFEDRARWFLVDNERGERVWLELEGRRFVSDPTAANGHFQADVRIPEGRDGRRIQVHGGLVGSPLPVASGRARLLGPRGLSIISDLDDTVRRTGVLETRELIASTFFRPFEAVPGMAEAYRRWAEQGAVVHFLTASPWQLYFPLSEWLDQEGFPWVSLEMRHFRVKDRSFVRFFRSSEKYKAGRVGEILEAFPGRRFVLIGDSGEHDPEVYGRIARRFPGAVAGILIRDVVPGPGQPERYRAAFGGLEGVRWLVFREAGELPSVLASWLEGDGPPVSASGTTCR